MINWMDIIVAREYHQELSREAEKARLVRQLMAGNDKPRTWQRISDLVFRNNQKKQPARSKAQDRKQACLAKESG